MRRIVIALSIAVSTLLASGVAAPAVPSAHAQTRTPTLAVSQTTVPVGSQITVSGNGFTPYNRAFVYWVRPDGTSNGIQVPTDAAGHFAFTLGFSAAHGTGNERITGYDVASGCSTPVVTVMVTSGGPPPVNNAHLSASPNPVFVGYATTVSGAGFTPSGQVYVQWRRPDGTTNATYVNAGPGGSFAFTLGFLRQHGCGTEVLQAYNFATATWTATYPITVTGC